MRNDVDEQPRTDWQRVGPDAKGTSLITDKVYTTPGGEPTADRPERQGFSRRSIIDAAKAVPTIDLADLLCGPGRMKRIGENWTALCPLPDHNEKTPSFTVYPGDRGWFCFGCQRGGDVVDLARLAWEIDRADVAAAEALMTFGRDIPARPPSWFDRQKRQAPMRSKIENVRVEVLMRRLFRWVFEPMLARIEDADERAEMAARLWAEVLPLAVRLVEDRRAAS